MAGSWGTKTRGCRIGLFYDDVEVSSDGSKGRITGGKIKLDVDQHVTDQTNKVIWTDTAVANGTKSNINIDLGVGSMTLANVTGEWRTLSSTTEVTAKWYASLEGLSYTLGVDLKHNITVTLPKRKGTGTPLPPEVVDPSAPYVPNPWSDPSMPDVYSEQLLEHTFKVSVPTLAVDKRTIPAWDIQVTLDGGRSPYATASFKAPIEYLLDPGMMPATSPFAVVPVQIEAGWRYGATVNQHPLFSGVITSRELVIEEDSTYLAFEAESYEVIYNYPSNKALGVNNAHTRVSQFFTVTGTDLYRTTAFVDTQAGTPSSSELTEFRAMVLELNDDLGDFMRSLTSALNQWARGSMTALVPTVEVLHDPFPYSRLWQLPVTTFSKLSRLSSLSDWGNVVDLTTEWTDSTTGDTKSKRRVYASVEAASGTEAVRGTQVTIRVKPPGGATPSASWPTGLRWLRRTDTMSRAAYSGECRAIWWLQPKVDGIQLLNNPLAEGPGAIRSVTFLVDIGMMNLTWSAVSA